MKSYFQFLFFLSAEKNKGPFTSQTWKLMPNTFRLGRSVNSLNRKLSAFSPHLKISPAFLYFATAVSVRKHGKRLQGKSVWTHSLVVSLASTALDGTICRRHKKSGAIKIFSFFLSSHSSLRCISLYPIYHISCLSLTSFTSCHLSLSSLSFETYRFPRSTTTQRGIEAFYASACLILGNLYPWVPSLLSPTTFQVHKMYGSGCCHRSKGRNALYKKECFLHGRANGMNCFLKRTRSLSKWRMQATAFLWQVWRGWVSVAESGRID